jgi:formate dehydrogenase-N alpha subunit
MTNHWIDLKNSDCIFVIGANPAENHPASMYWVNAAVDKGAKLVVVDPRFTRTAAKAQIYAPLRSGTDIPFLGGMINYVLQNELYHKEYVVNFTNAASLIHPDFKGPADLDGFFSGYDMTKRTYDQSTWKYQTDADGNIKRDETLQDPNCVFQLLKKQYARYTPDMVSKVTGCPKDQFLKVAETFAATGQAGKAGTILYAMGQTQHTVGSQNVRAMAMLQLLLGNIGILGGGVNALRGESNVQGSTDMAVLFHYIPGYLGAPVAANHKNLAEYLEKETPKTSYWSNKPKFLISLLKAWWGDAATQENDFYFDYLPKTAGNHSWISLFHALHDGKIKGMMLMGQNPAVSGPNARMERKALENLDWMVVMELFETETAGFWHAPGVNPSDVKTEVFMLPAADALEKPGSIVTSGRLIQWRPSVARAPGDAQSDIWILDRLCKAVKQAYAGSTAAKDRSILDLQWDYGDPPDPERIALEVNGYWASDVVDDNGTVVGKKGDLLTTFGALRTDGATACGNWIYAGYFATADDGEGRRLPACKRRGTKDPGGHGIYPNWGFVWPLNRHIIYNRCSADANGKPWSQEKALIWWDDAQKKWTGYDIPDFAGTKAPSDAGGKDPFIMKTDGKGWLFGALLEGPFPEHYEPLESPAKNLLSSLQNNPVIKLWTTDQDKEIGDHVGTADKYPIVATTYRVVEHWQAGAMSRTLPWLVEAQPELFVEMGKDLASRKGIQNGDRVTVSSARGQITAVAIVTDRLQPMNVDGKQVDLVGLPWHFGWAGIATGDSANDITPHIGDANTMIPEYKAFLVDIRKAV